ncbi:hypothetical protein EF294_13570 [Gordonia oryzae]|uniref:Uncharacterized protein n=1 Tax=Gordonia oryzae TaxID=2487349 RepID=A0A3N4G9Q8_9ACTN|nr:hypothetical protein EF294_13570 [Gordonia oryzae]
MGGLSSEETVGLDYSVTVLYGATEAARRAARDHPGTAGDPAPALVASALDGSIGSDPSLADPVVETVRGLPVRHVTLERDRSPDSAGSRRTPLPRHRGAASDASRRLHRHRRLGVLPPDITTVGLAPRSTRWITVRAICDVIEARKPGPTLVEASLRWSRRHCGGVRPRPDRCARGREAESRAGGDPIV